MKNLMKTLSLAAVMVFIFTGASLAKTNDKLHKSSIEKSKNNNKGCLKIVNEDFEFEFGGKCDSVIAAAESAEKSSRNICKVLPNDAACTDAQAAEDATEKAKDDCLSNQQSKVDSIVKLANAAATILKNVLTITINTQKPTQPKTPAPSPSNPADVAPITPEDGSLISPFDIDN